MSEQQSGNQSVERPLDRLNYYNGQRLEARDLRLEQAYHMRMRRWLNKSLYPDGGIVNGLVVTPIEGKLEVKIAAGLALDTKGREIILLEDWEFPCPASPGNTYLTIRYDEYRTAHEEGDCRPRRDDDCQPRPDQASEDLGSSPARGGPALIRSDPKFAWRSDWPLPDSDEVLLGRVILTEDCKAVEAVDLSDNTHVDASRNKVRQYALEGTRDIDENNPARIYFHIRGRQPISVALYLRSETLSTLHYTELGRHDHGTYKIGSASQVDSHIHDIDALSGGKHVHSSHELEVGANTNYEVWTLSRPIEAGSDNIVEDLIEVFTGEQTYTSLIAVMAALGIPSDLSGSAITLAPGRTGIGPLASFVPGHNYTDLKDTIGMRINIHQSGGHSHSGTTDIVVPGSQPDILHKHHMVGSSSLNPGAAGDVIARTGSRITYITDLRVSISNHGLDPQDRTDEIISDLQNVAPDRWSNDAAENPPKLGNGGDSPDPLVEHGTGAIELNRLRGVNFTEGEHYIELSVPPLLDEDGNPLEDDDGNVLRNGGRIVYNLYVE